MSKRYGVMPESEIRKNMLNVARGKTPPNRNAPKLWFTSEASVPKQLKNK